MFSFYSKCLSIYPKSTNFISTGLLFGTGDFIAQSTSEGPFDYARTLRSVAYGSCVFSFIGDKWYRLLAKVKYPGKPLNSNRLNSIRTGITKTAVDQLLWAPVGIGLYFTVMSIFERKSYEQAKQKLIDNYWVTLKINWYVWPLFQLFNLNLVPVHYQLLTVNLFSIIWNTFLSLRNNYEGHK